MEEKTKINRVVTVTLNPSLDKTLITNHLHLGYHNHVTDTTQLDASGRGVNVSRALDYLNTPTLAVVLLGNKAISRAYRGLIAEEDFPFKSVQYDGAMRSDTIIVDVGAATETHIIDEGAACFAEDAQNVLDTVVEVLEPNDFVVLAGTLPPEAAPNLYADIVKAVDKAAAKVVMLTSGEPLKQSLNAQPEIVMLTRLEAEVMFNFPVRNYDDMVSGCRKLLSQGASQALVVAEDFSGAVLVDESNCLTAEVDDLAITGTASGVVDGMMAGYLAGLARGLSVQEAFVLGMAALAFSASQIGNRFGTMNQLEELLHQVHVRDFETKHGLISVP